MEQVYTPKQNYKVVCFCNTYNQSKYITDALRGFCMQKTNFPYVCLVMDDCSTDGEQNVLKAWIDSECNVEKANYEEIELANITIVPHKYNPMCLFVFYFLKKNLFGTGRKIPLRNVWFEHCTYVAECEGDDFWIDETKLQQQVEILDAHPEYSMCSHRIYKYDQNNKLFRKDSLDSLFIKSSKGYEYDQNVEIWLYETNSVMHRVSAREEYDKFPGPKRDGAFNYYMLKYHKGYIINKVMGVYRLADSGIYANKSVVEKHSGGYLCYKALYEYEQTPIARKKYYMIYASLFIASKGKILLTEKFNLSKFLSLFYYIPAKIFHFHNFYHQVDEECNRLLLKKYIK